MRAGENTRESEAKWPLPLDKKLPGVTQFSAAGEKLPNSFTFKARAARKTHAVPAASSPRSGSPGAALPLQRPIHYRERRAA